MKKRSGFRKVLALILSLFLFIEGTIMPAGVNAEGTLDFSLAKARTVKVTKKLKAVKKLKGKVNADEGYITLSWNSPYDDYTAVIERSVGNKKNFKKYDTVDITRKNYSYTDYSVTTGICYYYRVKVTSYSKEVTVTTKVTTEAQKEETTESNDDSDNNNKDNDDGNVNTDNNDNENVDNNNDENVNNNNDENANNNNENNDNDTTEEETTEEQTTEETTETRIDDVTYKGSSKYVYTDKLQLSLEAPVIEKIEAGDNKVVKLYWKDVSDADGYKIYRRKGVTGTFKRIRTIKATQYLNNKVYYWDTYYGYHILTDKKDLKIGTTYYYKICAYKLKGKIKCENKFSKTKKVTVTINKTKIQNGVSSKPKTNTIRWKRVDNASGYIVYYSKKETGKYHKLKTLKGKNKTVYTHKNLTNGTKYYYKVVAYKNSKGKKIKSSSEIYSKYCDYYAHANETYTERCQRIFGTNYKKTYSSDAEARTHMKTISIKVWDINSSNKWYTRTFSLTVHENIAPTVEQIFKELYASSNPTPIHSIGCYSYRTGEHSLGLAIDINPNENYMIDGDEIQSGSFWDPSSSVYSIPLKCDLVTIFNKYGYRRGFWGYRKDYMHFSYFGT